MSEFCLIEIELNDSECVVKSLVEMGYKPEVHDSPVNLYGYQGDVRKQKAHIVIPRSQVGSASNDVGFEKVNGKFVMHLSEYDKRCKLFNYNKLKQIYSKHLISKVVRSKPSRFRMGSTNVDKDGNIKMKIRVMK